ncbi:MAG: polysaccharide pyruvyl transferase family protein [Candidatus Pacebacteria bacterium]|nr:polysaccharide pyruvyl transferase family protein [Candidatus Paceibacterota bacterium]
MKIAVFGWYGHENAGDERIKFCINHFLTVLGGIDRVDFFDLHENAIKGKTNQFDHYDLVIIGGGGLIFSQSNYHDFIYGIDTKIVTAGISVETALKGNPKKFAVSLLEKSLVVLVRDSDSAQKLSLLDCKNKVKVSSDLTFLESYPTVELKNDNFLGINFLPKPRDFKYSTLVAPWMSFILEQCSRFGMKNILRTVNFETIINELKNKFHLLPIPLYCAKQQNNLPVYQKNDVEFLKLYYQDVPSSFSDSLIDKCSAFLSMRLHGSIFAVQKGVPVVSFPYLPKNRSFMTAVGLGDFVVDSINPQEVLYVVEDSINNQKLVREKMESFKEEASKKIKKDFIEILNHIK